jgi:phospholipase/carboxylesterase
VHLAQLEQSGTHDSGDPAIQCAVFTPDHHEPGYDYPLVVWFHDRGENEKSLLTWMPRISRRNYLGLGLQGPLPVVDGLPDCRRWSLGDRALIWLEEELALSLCDLCDRVNAHRQRIVVAGSGQGGTVALSLLIRRPEWFAAGVCLNARWTPENRLESWGAYCGKPLWLGHSLDWAPYDRHSAGNSWRLLRAAGFDVTRQFYDFDRGSLSGIGRDIDRWLLPRLCGNRVIA